MCKVYYWYMYTILFFVSNKICTSSLYDAIGPWFMSSYMQKKRTAIKLYLMPQFFWLEINVY